MPSTTVKLVQDSRVLTQLHERDGAAEERTMATHMKALVDKVTIEPSLLTPLPESVAVALKRQATALQERLPLLDAELGLVYPPIDVLPVLMETPGNVGAIHARMSLKSFAGITRKQPARRSVEDTLVDTRACQSAREPQADRFAYHATRAACCCTPLS